jgi:hypothetical protein
MLCTVNKKYDTSLFFFLFPSAITQKIEQSKGKDWQTAISNRTRAKKMTSKEK